MAVLKIKPKKVVDFFLALVERESILPLVATRVPGELFKGAKNDTVTLRIPGLKAKARTYDWRTRTGPIVLDDIAGGASVDIKLDTHVYSATGLTDEHWTLDEIDFATEVIKPQADAVGDDLEARVVAALRAAEVKHELNIEPDSDPLLFGVEARRVMDSDKVAPRNGRFFLIGTDIEAAWLASDRLSRYDSTGQEGTPALREAIVGRLAGSPVVVSSALEPNEGYYLHKSGLIVTTQAPAAPRGAVATASVTSKNGFSARWLADYDPQYLRDRSIVSTFFGGADFRDERNADGSWMWQEGDDEEQYTLLGFSGVGSGDTNIRAAGTRKNVRIVKLTGSEDFGSVLPAES